MKPSNTVTAGAVAGCIVVILTWALQQFLKVTLPAEVGAALSTLLTFAVQWTVPADRPPEERYAPAPPADSREPVRDE